MADRNRRMRLVTALPPLLLLAACHGGANEAAGAKGAGATNYAGIGEGETLRFTGTEPFWGGRVTGGALTYETPEKPEGIAIAVRRLAGNNGLAFSGTVDGGAFDMAVSEAPCSDGMSDRTYPFTVTLQFAGETRHGCGWTDARKFTGPESP
ncbi:MAG: hypothetical protein WCY29_13300 [Novosphingobium sp.]